MQQDSLDEDIESEQRVQNENYEEVNHFPKIRRDHCKGGYRNDLLREIGLKVEIPKFTGHAYPQNTHL